MPTFSHLHVHTQYSLLDGAADIKKLMKKAKADGMPAVAITDHGNMFGAFEFYQAAKSEGILPVIGCEFYMVEDRFIKTFGQGKKDKRYHQLLLAKNQKGYENLAKLCSLGYLEGFYSKYPRVDKALIKQYSEGLIATSCCIGAEIPQAILFKSEEEAEKLFVEWHELFGDDFYVELQRHNLKNIDNTGKSQEDVNQVLIKFARKYNVSIIATNDSHYIDESDANAHDILLCINTSEFQSTPKATNEESGKGYRFGFPNEQFFFKTQAEMEELFKDIPEALDNTNKLIDSIEPPKLARDIVLPHYIIPDGFESQNDYITHLAVEGCKKRYGGSIPGNVEERLNFELNTIRQSGFAGYFLIVQDFTTAARDMGVWVGPGRGSAAGSLVAYCLGITNVDPVKYDLLFERFLNPERVSMPDVDIDFDDVGRDRVIEYVAKKYGERRIAQIVTYGTMAAKSAIRDVGRVLQYPLPQTDRLAKLVPGNLNFKTMLHSDLIELAKDDSKNLKVEEIDNLKELQRIYNSNEPAAQVLRDAEKLEGSVRNTGVHACGIIIAPRDIDEVVPVAKSKDSQWMQVQYDVTQIEKAGLLKMDFLGLSTLSIMKDAIALIFETVGVQIDLDSIPLDDLKTYELFQRGETNGIFQFESPGMQKHMRDLKPTQFGDLIAMNALYRPGPMKYIPDFVDRKHGRKPVEYDLPEMEDYLRETYGITVYQEQVMLLSQKLAGFSKGKADVLRKAMGKKDKKLIDDLKADFMDGAREKGYPDSILEKIYSDWEEFAQYAFNKSHSTCYAVIAFQTAYLKANFPAQYMAAVLKSNMGDIKKITFYMEECRRMDMKVLGPDLNESNSAFTVTKNNEIRFGMNAVKGIGEGAVLEILADREKNGAFNSIFDLTSRVNLRAVNKRNLENMAKSGVFDFDTRYHRAQYVMPDSDGRIGIELALKHGQNVQSDKISGQTSLFGGGGESTIPQEPKLPNVEPFSLHQELKIEEELVGVFLSKHPLDDIKFVYSMVAKTSVKELSSAIENNEKSDFRIMGIITSAREVISQKGNPYGRFAILDYSGSIELNIFAKPYMTHKNLLSKDYIVIISGTTEPNLERNDARVNFNSITLASEVNEKSLVKSLKVEMTPLEIEKGKYQVVQHMIEQYPGSCSVIFNFSDIEENMSVAMVSKYGIQFNSDVVEMLKEMEVYFTPITDERWA
jgi:DNA polymerase-3 subunit alpha